MSCHIVSCGVSGGSILGSTRRHRAEHRTTTTTRRRSGRLAADPARSIDASSVVHATRRASHLVVDEHLDEGHSRHHQPAPDPLAVRTPSVAIAEQRRDAVGDGRRDRVVQPPAHRAIDHPPRLLRHPAMPSGPIRCDARLQGVPRGQRHITGRSRGARARGALSSATRMDPESGRTMRCRAADRRGRREGGHRPHSSGRAHPKGTREKPCNISG